jgi:hypothetical protein
VYVGRYTLPSKQRVPMPGEPTWVDAFAKATAEQQKVDRNRHRDVATAASRSTSFVDVHWMPTLGRISPNTPETTPVISAPPPGVIGRSPRARRRSRPLRFQLRAVFGTSRIMDIQPQDLQLWQARMPAAGYEHDPG